MKSGNRRQGGGDRGCPREKRAATRPDPEPTPSITDVNHLNSASWNSLVLVKCEEVTSTAEGQATPEMSPEVVVILVAWMGSVHRLKCCPGSLRTLV